VLPAHWARWIGGHREACRIARQAEQTLLISAADREGDIYALFVEAQRAVAGPAAESVAFRGDGGKPGRLFGTHSGRPAVGLAT